jgi:hypothetical protein
MRPAQIILLIALLFTCSADAQFLSLRDTSGNPVGNGDTILVTGTTDVVLQGLVNIYNSSPVTKYLLVKKQNLSLVVGSLAPFAWYMEMYMDSVTISPDTAPAGGNSIFNYFAAWLDPYGFAGTSFIRYNFFDANNIADSAWVVFQYNVLQAAGIAQLDGSDVFGIYPNPGNGVFSFSPPAAFRDYFSVEVYSAQGAMVRKKNFFSPALASMDITSAVPGIYFVKLSDGEKTFVKTFVKE